MSTATTGGKNRLEEIDASLKTKCERVAELIDKIDGETAPTEEQLNGWNGEIKELRPEIEALNQERAAAQERQKARSEVEATLGDLAAKGFGAAGLRFAEERAKQDGGAQKPIANVKELARVFTESPAYRDFLARYAPTGRLPDANPSQGSRLPDGDALLLNASIKTIITGISSWAQPSDTSGDALVVPRFRGVVDMGTWMVPDFLLSVADLVTHEQTDADVIFYVKVTNGTQAAAGTAEASAENDTSGTKPQGEITFTQGTALVHTIAVWVPVTRQALAASNQLRGVIERYLSYELRRELTHQIIDGSGSGENFRGVQNLTNVLTQSAVTGDILATARKALTHLLLAGRTMPNAWVMHPNDMEAFDLTRDEEARYYFGGPQSAEVPRLWGVPVRQNEYVDQGVPILGDWSRYVVADREQTTIRISDQHASYFIRNMIAVLGEFRAAGYAERDEAFCLVSLS